MSEIRPNPFQVLNTRLEVYLNNHLPASTAEQLNVALMSARNQEDRVSTEVSLPQKMSSMFRRITEEPGVSGALLSVFVGYLSKDYAESRGNRSPIGEFLIKAPIAVQATVEMRKFVESNGEVLAQGNEEMRSLYESIASKYGLDSNSPLFQDPKMVANLRKSFLLWGPYGETVKYIGIPVQAGLSALFLAEPTLHQCIKENWLSVNAGAVVATGGALYWRAKQEITSIEELGYNPDFLQTAPVLLTARVNSEGEMVKDTNKWVWIVNGVDMVKVMAMYNLPFAWNIHLFTAAMLTNVVDQLYHGGFNIALRAIHNRRHDKDSKSIN